MHFLENLSSLTQNSHAAAWCFDAVLKSFIILTLAGGVVALLRRAAAATRHLVWFLALLSLLCLPLLSLLMPSWENSPWTVSTGFDSGNQVSLAIDFAPTGQTETTTPNLPATSKVVTTTNHGTRKITTRFSVNWLAYGLTAWMVGTLLVIMSVVAGPIRLLKFSRIAQPQQNEDWTRLLAEVCFTLQLRRNIVLLQSSENVMPLTWGWWRPVVLLPAEAVRWTAERRRIVLLHELAHVKRWDCLTQMVAKIVCALYWFNPLVWFAAQKMCIERESACDDLVLGGGCKASDYAGHLVEIAESFRRAPQMAAITMARPTGLEQRVAAIVDSSRNRRLRRLTLLTVLAAVSGIVFCISGCKTTVARSSTEKLSPLREQLIARLETFSRLKEKQSEVLASAAGEKISPEYKRLFTAATKGDWQTVTNMYASFKCRHPQYGHPHQHSDLSLRTSYWQPVLEICLAYDQVVRCDPKYTQLAVDDILDSIPAGSIYFGGTDPGRGLPTAFCKSQPDADPFYTLTQNALADGTYLEYLRETYGDQRPLLKQLAEACRKDKALQALNDKWLAAVQKLDSLDIDRDSLQWQAANDTVNILWQQREDRAKALRTAIQHQANSETAQVQNQTIPDTFYIPTAEDSQRSFEEYVTDVTKRYHSGQLKSGENVKISDGRTQISGKVAVMQINSLLVKTIFDRNPGHEFYIEESFPLDWMYPYLEPHGLIFKINRQPLPALSEVTVQKDQTYWQPLMKQMIGGWLNSNTSVKDVTSFAKKVFLQHKLDGFTGDPDFVQNDYASRMFSKLRVSIAGLYAWRSEHATSSAEKERMADAADYAFRQALALCPYSTEATKNYADFLKSQNRLPEANLVSDTEEMFKIEAKPDSALNWTNWNNGQMIGSFYAVAGTATETVVVGIDGRIATRDNRTGVWKLRTFTGDPDFRGIVHADGKYVVVREKGSIMTSPDGITWTKRVSPTTKDLLGLFWDGHQFLAGGDRGTILASPDGINWTSRKSGSDINLYSFSYSGSRYVAVGNDGILISDDSKTWTQPENRGKTIRVPFTACVWTGNEFFACGLGLDRKPTIYTSPDGDVWTLRDHTVMNSLRAAIVVNNAVYIAGDSVIKKSTDGGSTWQDTYTNPKGNELFMGLAFNGQSLIAAGFNHNVWAVGMTQPTN